MSLFAERFPELFAVVIVYHRRVVVLPQPGFLKFLRPTTLARRPKPPF